MSEEKVYGLLNNKNDEFRNFNKLELNKAKARKARTKYLKIMKKRFKAYKIEQDKLHPYKYIDCRAFGGWRIWFDKGLIGPMVDKTPEIAEVHTIG